MDEARRMLEEHAIAAHVDEAYDSYVNEIMANEPGRTSEDPIPAFFPKCPEDKHRTPALFMVCTSCWQPMGIVPDPASEVDE